jgi:hypothetical protein
MTVQDTSRSEEVEAILKSDLPDLEKLALAFDCITSFIVAHAEGEIELARAMHDRDQRIKVQIKMETMKHARSIFDHCYLRITGRRPWDAGARQDT